MSSDINVQTFSGKVNITSNLLVGSTHLFVDTTNNRVGLVTVNPQAGLHVNSNAYVDTDFRVGPSIVMNETSGRITAGSFEGDGSGLDHILNNISVGATATSGTSVGVTVTDKPSGAGVDLGFTIPVGADGAAGHTISSVSASTGAVGVSMTGTTAKSLAFTIPAGAQGIQGIQGATGITSGTQTISGLKTYTSKLSIPSGVSYTPGLQLGTQTTYADDNLYGIRWGGNTLMGMGLHSSTRGVFGKQGVCLHIPDTEEFSVKTSGWTSIFACDGATRRVYVSGNVGIGISSPLARLHVNGYGIINMGSGARSYFRQSFNNVVTNVGTWSSAGIYAQSSIVTSSYFGSVAGALNASDERIKKDIVDIDDGSALETLRLLKPKQYKYKDDIMRGSEPVWGFIAQEVRETLPYATQIRTDTLPNIYELATVSNSNVITLTNFNTSNLVSNTSTISVYDAENNKHSISINEIIDDHTIRVEEDLNEMIGSVDETGNAVAGNELFVYGEDVDDFIYLKKDAIFTVATAALQEVDRQLQAEKIENEITRLKLANAESRIAILEQSLGSILSKLNV